MNDPVVDAAEMRRHFLAGRRSGIGSSDIAKVCGLSPYGGPLDVYLDKLGLYHQPENQAMRMGTLLEPIIAQLYTERVGAPLILPAVPTSRHLHYPWAIASPDRIDVDRSRIVELKTSGSTEGWGQEGTDEVPPGYLVQVQWQLFVVGVEQADVAVLLRGQEFRVYSVMRSELIINHLLSYAQEFWRMVQSRTPPPPDFGREGCAALVNHLWRPQPELEVQLEPESDLLAREYLDIGPQIKALELRRESARAQLLYQMQEAGVAYTPAGVKLTRKVVPVKESVHAAREDVRLYFSDPSKKRR